MNKCVLCSKPDEKDTDSDYLRTLYITSQGKLWDGYYKPHLTSWEKWKLQAAGKGEHPVCSNRANCRKRYEAIYFPNS